MEKYTLVHYKKVVRFHAIKEYRDELEEKSYIYIYI